MRGRKPSCQLRSKVHCWLSLSASLRDVLSGRKAEIVVLEFISSVWISCYWHCPGTEGWPLSCRGACDIFSKGSTKYALNSKSILRYFCRLSLGIRWCVSSLLHQEPHVASSSAFLKGRMQGRKRGGEWDRGYDGRKCATWAFLRNSAQSSHKAVTNADVCYYIAWLENLDLRSGCLKQG